MQLICNVGNVILHWSHNSNKVLAVEPQRADIVAPDQVFWVGFYMYRFRSDRFRLRPLVTV